MTKLLTEYTHAFEHALNTDRVLSRVTSMPGQMQPRHSQEKDTPQETLMRIYSTALQHDTEGTNLKKPGQVFPPHFY